jgi:3-oxoacyl-[acyl-carrier protein] reductase
MDLKDARVLVTGAGANIGRAVALAFAESGARVAITTRSNIEGARETVRKIEAAGAEALFLKADVTREDEVKELFEGVAERFGGLDILVNNAGAARPTPFSNSSLSEWREVFDVNLFSALLCSQQAVPLMKKEGPGCIINTVSVRGFGHTGREGIMAYSAAKAALINFTKTLAKELAPSIRVNAVAPGFVESSAYDGAPEELKQSFLDSTLIKRWISPAELSAAYTYLASQEAVTGTVVTVDGGFLLKEG